MIGELPKASKGFTLVEVLAVSAIIASLSAILFPVITTAKSASRSRCCQSNLKQLALAATLYADTYNGRFPVQTRDGVADWNSPAAEANWAKSLEKYVRNARIPKCPCADKSCECKTNCSMAVNAASYPISYLGNGKIFSDGINESAIRRSSRTILFQCGGRTWNKCWLAPALDEEYGEWEYYTSRSWCNHNKGTNVAFVDSHIEWRSYEGLSKDTSPFNP